MVWICVVNASGRFIRACALASLRERIIAVQVILGCTAEDHAHVFILGVGSGICRRRYPVTAEMREWVHRAEQKLLLHQTLSPQSKCLLHQRR